MEFAFNDLSTQPLSADCHAADEKMALFSRAYAIARKKGVKNIRSPKYSHEILLTTDYTLHDWLNNREVRKELRDNLYGAIILPFIRDQDEQEVAKFIAIDKFYYEDLANGFSKQECLGLVAAYVYDSVSLSLDSAPVWQQRALQIFMQESSGDIRTQKILNTYSPECFDTSEVTLVIEHGVELNLIETDIDPVKKNLHLTSHHGRKELLAFWKRIRTCRYVVAALSVEWGGNNFIREVMPDGCATFVLTNTDRKYALKVETTGSTRRETQAIADYIQDNYE